MYSLLLKILFLFDPEDIHHFTLSFLHFFIQIPFAKNILRALYLKNDTRLAVNKWGLHFRNPVGLAAGFDKNAKYIEVMECLGFGYVEIGTVTPLAQAGNDRPRLFRLPKDKAIINRMGFNNDGADSIVERLKALKKRKILIGGNIGKNKITPNENAVDDYIICFEKLFDHVDYFVVNVSSPNTPGLRALQDKDSLLEILGSLQKINLVKAKPKPILLKIAPDLGDEQIHEIVEIVNTTKIQGIIATNTTISRETLDTDEKVVESIGAGGLSGKPVREKSNRVINIIQTTSNKSIDIIGVGGIMNRSDAIEKFQLGCCLIQLYTGFIYEGPGLAKKICKTILSS
ncbi:MAG: quinone-dependent dihydroorotate dehydrogenase [Bacteroidota bacterium]